MKPEAEAKGGPASETLRVRLEVGEWEESGFMMDIGVRRREQARPCPGLWAVDASGTPEDPGRLHAELVPTEEGFWPSP